MREARTKAQESYLVGVVYSTCRVDLSRYPGSGRYRGIRAILSRFHATYEQKCAYMSTLCAWEHRCHRHVDRHTWAAGSEPTDVAHVIVSTRRMGRGPREMILLLCPIWINWFDVSTRTSSPQRGVIVTARGPCWAGSNVRHCSKKLL